MSVVALKVPALGESITEATIGVWNVKPGQAVTLDEPIVEVESEKATVEVPAPATGVIKRILKEEGDTAEVGETIAEIEEGASASADAPAPVQKAEETKAEAPTAPPKESPKPAAAPAKPAERPSLDGIKASPALRKMIAEGKINPAALNPSVLADALNRQTWPEPFRAALKRPRHPCPSPVKTRSWCP